MDQMKLSARAHDHLCHPRHRRGNPAGRSHAHHAVRAWTSDVRRAVELPTTPQRGDQADAGVSAGAPTGPRNARASHGRSVGLYRPWRIRRRCIVDSVTSHGGAVTKFLSNRALTTIVVLAGAVVGEKSRAGIAAAIEDRRGGSNDVLPGFVAAHDKENDRSLRRPCQADPRSCAPTRGRGRSGSRAR